LLQGAQVAVLVPACNEAAHIAATLTGIPAFVDRIVVVDDGSHDATATLAAGAGDPRVVVIRHTVNRGVGAALRTGYRDAFAHGAQAVAVMAGDGQMDPLDLHRLLLPVLAGDCAYAKGDRLSHPEVRRAMPALRLLGNRLLSALTRVCVGLGVRDSQCGYTALGSQALPQLALDELWPGYGYPNDLLARLSLAGLRVRDVVVRPIYGDEVSGLGFRHALVVIPYVLLRALVRRLRARASRATTRLLRPAL
jgi:glycosyltransferase involved in cell wall biosynthesis